MDFGKSPSDLRVIDRKGNDWGLRFRAVTANCLVNADWVEKIRAFRRFPVTNWTGSEVFLFRNQLAMTSPMTIGITDIERQSWPRSR